MRRLFTIFGENNCPILLNEELRGDHKNTPGRVFDFLNVDNSRSIPPEASVFEQEYTDKIDKELYSRLIDIFHFDIKELERLLKRDLSAWVRRQSQIGVEALTLLVIPSEVEESLTASVDLADDILGNILRCLNLGST